MRRIFFTFFIFFVPAILFSQTITNGLIGYWPFNGNANDVIGGNHGSVIGATQVADMNSNANSAYRLMNNYYINIGDPAVYDFGSSEFSVSLWVYLNTNISGWHGALISKWNTGGNPGSNEWFLGAGNYTVGESPGFSVEIGSVGYGINSSVEMNVQQWYHLVAIRKSNGLEMYLNGQKVAERSDLPVGSITNVAGRELQIGRSNNYGSGVWMTDGNVDDIMIFDRALDSVEIQTLFMEGVDAGTPLIHTDGLNFGIGTSSNSGYKLAVAGKTITEEIKVAPEENWPDYVFDEDYELKDIEEVENYINNNKHLPGIPSAMEVEEEGIELGAMNVKLLEKIEELTLHMIELDKRLEKLEAENRKLKEKK